MKHLFLISSLLLILAACESSVKNPKEPIDTEAETEKQKLLIQDSTKWTTVKWLDSVQNFGKVRDGEKVLVTFHFKNTGSNPLIISSVQASCGCTVPSKPEEPIAPGAEGQIKAEFNSSGRVGKATKNLTVYCNTKEQNYLLLFEGEVLPKK